MIEDRFWPKVDLSGGPDACWPWLAATNAGGYGIFYRGPKRGRMHIAHRVAFELFVGPIPEGQDVLHHCDNPPCVNPAHLYLGTDVENARDRHVRGRDARGSRNGLAKLTEEAVVDIRARYARGGILQRELAEEHGVDPSLISRIVSGELWREEVMSKQT